MPTPSSLSFEFFPPKTEEGMTKLRLVRDQLSVFKPEFFSVTFGAGGTTRDGTLAAVTDIQAAGHVAAPHLSCVGSSRDSLRGILADYQALGIHRLVALRGDMPSGMGATGDFRYANELVEFIRQETGDFFHIEVAAYPEFHPQAPSAQADIQRFVDKMNAGANSAITQYFFNADAYFHFVEEVRALGVTAPIVPGIMPINHFGQLCRFSEMCGAEVPRWLRLKMQSYMDDTASIRALGLDVITEMSEKLLAGGAPSLHFYTLNQSDTVKTICERLGYAQP
jgi:methylenetetrahydrofolate reductase (NADPH)